MIAASLKKRAMEIGFDLAGIAPISAWKDLEFSRKWVERGYGGEMQYLKNPKREDPRSILPSVKSVVCVGLVYNAPLPYSTETASRDSGAEHKKDGARSPRGWVSRYAWGHDYHETMRSKLEHLRKAIEEIVPGAETRVYVDTGPIVERAFARLSGIGWMGKNTCLINEKKGSWFFLGVILTSLEFESALPAPDRCGSCTRCIEACPTDALVEPYVMDASRCIAYLTIELKGSIPAQFRPAIGSNVFGCDICQDVCPWNGRNSGGWQAASDEMEIGATPRAGGQPSTLSRQRSVTRPPQEKSRGFGRAGAAATSTREFQPLTIAFPDTSHLEPDAFSLFNPHLENLASLSEEDFRRVFARSPIKRTKYRGWVRNLCIAMGNSKDRRFVPWLENAKENSDEVVREHAEWAIERIGGEADRKQENEKENSGSTL